MRMDGSRGSEEGRAKLASHWARLGFKTLYTPGQRDDSFLQVRGTRAPLLPTMDEVLAGL